MESRKVSETNLVFSRSYSKKSHVPKIRETQGDEEVRLRVDRDNREGKEEMAE